MVTLVGANLDTALALAGAGLSVFPCHAGGDKAKQPMPFIRWRDASTTSESQIRQWWQKWPDAAIGLDLGKCGLLVVDADRHGEHDGVEAWGTVMAAHGFDPDSAPLVATPNQGNHHFFRQPADRRLGNGRGSLPPGVDVRGEGGYVIAPGTVMADGRVYELFGDLGAAPAIPDWLSAILEGRRASALPKNTPEIQKTAHKIPKATLPAGNEIEELLSYIPPDLGYQDWIAVLMALHAVGASIDLADAWSARGSKYKGRREIEQKWRSFKRTGVTSRSLAMIAEQYGADLSEIAIRHNCYDPFEDEENRKYAAMLTMCGDVLIHAVPQIAPDTKGGLEWFDRIRPVIDQPYIIKGLIDWGAMSVIYGPSNSGKTFFALDLAFHCAIDNDGGTRWRSNRVHGGSVLYLAAEGGNGIANRIAALREATGCRDVPFALRRAGLDLLKSNADVDGVIKLAREVFETSASQLALIVIDTLSRVIAGGDENAASDMTAFIRNVDRIRHETGAHIMVVHHTGKDVARGARGHSSLRAATDTEIEVAVDDFGNRCARVTKQRDYEGGDEFHFKLKPVFLAQDSDGDDVTTCLVESVEKPKDAPSDLPPMATCKAILTFIDEAWQEKNPLSTSPQTKHSGRYASRLLAKQFSLNQGSVQKLLESWIDAAVLAVEVCNSDTKKRGLKVLDWLD